MLIFKCGISDRLLLKFLLFSFSLWLVYVVFGENKKFNSIRKNYLFCLFYCREFC